MNFTPVKRGGEVEKVVTILKRGHSFCSGSFYTIA